MDASDLDPNLIHGSLGPSKSSSKRHLDQFSPRNVTNRQTDRPTMHATPCVAIGRCR